MKISLKPVTVTYTRTLTFIPTSEQFADWDIDPDQESVNSLAFEDLFDIIHSEMRGPKNQFDLEHLKKIADHTLSYAKKIGATASEVEVSYGTGKNISVRLGSLENLEINRDKGFSVTLYNGNRKGSSSSSDLSTQSIEDTVDAAFNIARYTAEDPLFGLADKNLMATHIKDLDLHDAWDISIDNMIDLAKSCEASALDVSQKINNSEGASISSSEGIFIYANSHGFMEGYPTTRHSIACSVIAEEKSMMQRDYWYSSARHVDDLQSVDLVGKLAGNRTLSRLGAKKIQTCHAPVIFEAPIATGLISSLISAISGGNLYLSDARSQKYITYVNDRRYTDERQVLIVTLLHDDIGRGYINQYGRVETVGDLGSFDFSIEGSEGILQFYPTKYEINDYDITSLAYDLKSVYNGIGSTSIGNFVSIASSSVIVPSGTSTGIVGIATTLCSSAKVLVQISDNNGNHLYEELNVVHDGSEIQLLSYGTLSNNSLDAFGPTGLGTYYPYFSGTKLNINFVPNVGVGATVNTLGIFFAYPGSTGIGTFDMKHTRIESRSIFIASSGSPIETVIGEIVEPYQSAYFIVQVSDLTNNRYQISEVVAVDSSISAYATEFGNVETFNSLGSIGVTTAPNSLTQLTFTPLPGIDVEVKSYMNALRYEDDEKTLDFYDLNNSALETNFGTYTGTDIDIKRSFNLTHNSDPVFQRNFLGSDSNIVNVQENTITIANHFFVTGEEIKYTFGGSGTEEAIGIGTTYFVGIGTTDKLPGTLYAVKLNDSTIKLSASAEDALKTIPKVIDITSVGIGTSHTFTATNQNQRVIIAIDNIIQNRKLEEALSSSQLSQYANMSDQEIIDWA